MSWIDWRKLDCSYLRQGGVELPLQSVSLVADLVQFALCQAQILLRLSQRVQEPVPLLQHGHHQRLEMPLGIRLVRRPGALPPTITPHIRLADGRHHLAHHLGQGTGTNTEM